MTEVPSDHPGLSQLLGQGAPHRGHARARVAALPRHIHCLRNSARTAPSHHGCSWRGYLAVHAARDIAHEDQLAPE